MSYQDVYGLQARIKLFFSEELQIGRQTYTDVTYVIKLSIGFSKSTTTTFFQISEFT